MARISKLRHSSRSPVRRGASQRQFIAFMGALALFLAIFLLTSFVLEVKLEGLTAQEKNPLAGSSSSSSRNTKAAETEDEPSSSLEEFPPLSADEISHLHSIVDPLRVSIPGPPPDFTDYDVYNCPEHPPVGYPFEWNALQVLDHWSVDETDVPSDYIHQGLCVFTWPDARIQIYREAEVPFVLRDHDQVLQTAARWSTPGYLQDLLGDKPQRNEHSTTNHFQFWRVVGRGMQDADKKPPTDNVQLTFAEWHTKAQEQDATSENTPERERWYFRLNGERRSKTNFFLYDELPFFKPSEHGKEKLFMVDPVAERGINCRFGMKGVFAESHYDPTRNWIVVLGGQRRYMLSHPRECPNLNLYPIDHPSGRHSMVNWSHPRREIEAHPEFKSFENARMNEVVLQAGDSLYLPTSWFHAIVSLNTNYQCNARSGVTHESFPYLLDCGFGPPRGVRKGVRAATTRQ